MKNTIGGRLIASEKCVEQELKLVMEGEKLTQENTLVSKTESSVKTKMDEKPFVP